MDGLVEIKYMVRLQKFYNLFYAVVAQWLVHQFAILRMGVRFSSAAQYNAGVAQRQSNWLLTNGSGYRNSPLAHMGLQLEGRAGGC